MPHYKTAIPGIVSVILFAQAATAMLAADVAVISSLSPGNALIGSNSQPLVIAGKDIAAGSTVWWTDVNGQITVIAATAVKADQLTASIPANFLTAAGVAQVAISDPSGT